MVKYDIAIKLGAKNTIVYKNGVGIVFNEPSTVYKSTNKRHLVLGVGNCKIIDKDVEVMHPMADDYSMDLRLCAEYVRSVLDRLEESRTNVLMVIPSEVDSESKLNFEKVGYLANANSVTSVRSAICDLAGMDIDPMTDEYNVVLDLSDNAVCSVVIKGVVEKSVCIPYADSLITDEIQSYVKIQKNMLIDLDEVQKIKRTHLTILPGIDLTTKIVGQNVDTGEREESNLNSSQILDVVLAVFNKMVENVDQFLKNQNMLVCECIKNRGIIVTGRLSNMLGLEKYLKTKLNTSITIASNIHTSILGAGMLLKFPKILDTLS